MRKLPSLLKTESQELTDLLTETNENQCEECTKKSVCKYVERLKNINNDINELDDVIDLPVKIAIECEEREVKIYTF